MANQRDYYARTAVDYESTHVVPGDEHYVALEYISGICETVRAHDLLDVGAGTGRALSFLKERRPAMQMNGVEPVKALRDVAESCGVVDLIEASGEALPFADNSIDVVIATGVMHHVADPAPVIDEMTRVARKAVMISDSNRFGQSSTLANATKLGLKATRLWGIYMKARTRGAGHLYSEGDGVFYSYSIYDSYPQVTQWADRTYVVPTGRAARLHQYTGPLMGSTHGLLVGIKEPCFPGWAGQREDADTPA